MLQSILDNTLVIFLAFLFCLIASVIIFFYLFCELLPNTICGLFEKKYGWNWRELRVVRRLRTLYLIVASTYFSWAIYSFVAAHMRK